MSEERIVKEIHATLEKNTRINLHRYPIQIAVQNGDLVLEGVSWLFSRRRKLMVSKESSTG